MAATVPPLPLRMGSSRLKWAILLLLTAAFAVGGIWVAGENALAGYSAIAFFGIGTIVATVNLHPDSSYLLINVDGFTFSSLFRKHFVPWSQVAGFVPARVRTKEMVGWNYTPEYRGAQILRNLNTMLGGAEAALPDTYGKSAAELIELLEACRVRYSRAVS